MSTYNLCFGAKIRKIGTPLQTLFSLYKSGVLVGIHFMDMFPDVHKHVRNAQLNHKINRQQF